MERRPSAQEGGDTSRLLHFAHGANLLAARLLARCPSAHPRGCATVEGHRTAFDVTSAGGSTKVGLREDPTGTAEGRVWEIAEFDRAGLARAEGADDREVWDLLVTLADGAADRVTTWAPARAPEPGRPSHAYRALVVTGAEECGPEPKTIAAFVDVPSAVDALGTRASLGEAGAALDASGRLDLLAEDRPGERDQSDEFPTRIDLCDPKVVSRGLLPDERRGNPGRSSSEESVPAPGREFVRPV